MSKFRIVAIMALLIAPAFAFASQGGGTGQESVGSGSYLSSQGGGTGGDSVSLGSSLSSQGSGTGTDSQGSGTGGDSASSATWRARNYSENIQFTPLPAVSLWNCITNIQCILNTEEYSEK